MNILNFYLLNVNRELVRRLQPVTVLDTYEGATKNFHPSGLYSTSIFGPVGSDQRDETFSYIDINIDIISPMVALSLFELKRLYKDILAGKRMAVWSAEEKDFFPASPGDEGADTGYSFFMNHYKELSPKESKSEIRQQNIDILNAYRDIAMSRYVLVLPAGLRDIDFKDGARDTEDDINKLYRRLLTTSRMVPNINDKNVKSLDNVRWMLQDIFNQIFTSFFDVEDGKKGFNRSKYASRNLMNGTRNVISSMDASSAIMGSPDAIRPTDCIVGLVQGMRSILPVAIHAIRTRFSQHIDAGSGHLYLIDPETLKRERTLVSPLEYDKIVTDEGIEGLITGFKYVYHKHQPFLIDNKYVALLYVDKDKFKIFFDIEDLPSGFDRKKVVGISHAEFMYLSGYDIWNKYFMVITRYPVAGDGSTYPASIRLVTTVTSSVKYEYDNTWVTTNPIPAVSFPDRRIDEFMNSMAPNPTRITTAQADFDGDTSSGDAVYTDESVKEVGDKIDSPEYWVTVSGKLTIDINTDVVNLTLHNLLGDPE